MFLGVQFCPTYLSRDQTRTRPVPLRPYLTPYCFENKEEDEIIHFVAILGETGAQSKIDMKGFM